MGQRGFESMGKMLIVIDDGHWLVMRDGDSTSNTPLEYPTLP